MVWNLASGISGFHRTSVEQPPTQLSKSFHSYISHHQYRQQIDTAPRTSGWLLTTALCTLSFPRVSTAGDLRQALLWAGQAPENGEIPLTGCWETPEQKDVEHCCSFAGSCSSLQQFCQSEDWHRLPALVNPASAQTPRICRAVDFGLVFSWHSSTPVCREL